METPRGQDAATVTTAEFCFSTTMIIAVLIPVVVLLGLYILKPRVIMRKVEGSDKTVVNWMGFLKWGVVLSLLGWAGLYLYKLYAKPGEQTVVCVSVKKSGASAAPVDALPEPVVGAEAE